MGLSRILFPATAATAAVSYIGIQYQQFLALQDDSSVESKLPTTTEAQLTRVVRIPKLLTSEEIQQVHALHDTTSATLGSSGRTSEHQAAAYRAGSWETSYLNTAGTFKREAPALREKLLEAVRSTDAIHWQILDRAEPGSLNPRCVEYHRVAPGGSLPQVDHHDAGSFITLDVMLSDSSDFEGGSFRTLEADGEMKQYDFEAGDALLFVSHKPHCVFPVTAGDRRVLVMEVWEGAERECGHRCAWHFGQCNHSATDSFWNRALSDLASDL
jgi:predicted 2-oxoglutarate/Fe(II)-dependent dioxygenase YbiX